MPDVNIDGKYEGVVTDFSNSGNPVVKPGGSSKRTVVVAPDGVEIEDGDRITFVVRSEHESHYEAKLVDRSAPEMKYTDTSRPSIPIHHDGTSVGSSRSDDEAMKSVADREFDPKTHDAPPLERDKPKRRFLRSDE